MVELREICIAWPTAYEVRCLARCTGNGLKRCSVPAAAYDANQCLPVPWRVRLGVASEEGRLSREHLRRPLVELEITILLQASERPPRRRQEPAEKGSCHLGECEEPHLMAEAE